MRNRNCQYEIVCALNCVTDDTGANVIIMIQLQTSIAIKHEKLAIFTSHSFR